MKPHNFFDRSVSNRRGSAFVQALVAVGVVGLMIYFLSPTVVKHRQQVTKTASIITARLALHSMIDYTLYGIKQRWCFSEAWLGENCSSNANATAEQILSHPRSVERLIMKEDTLAYLKAMGVANPKGVLLTKFEQKISIGNFTSLHPVYKIVADLKGYKVSAFNVVIERDRLGLIPEYGREVYLKIKVQLLDEKGELIQVGSSKLEATSFVGVYPREVGSFALMVAGDLHLDRTSSAGLGLGSAYFNQFSSKTERSAYQGIVFESPIFVNGSIHLPAASALEEDKAESDTIYTPVTFKEKVILGEGPIKRSGNEFVPRTAGGSADEFWSNVRQFGGFQRGVEVDGRRDLGLDYLSGQAAGSAPISQSLISQCQKFIKARSDTRATANSTLRGQMVSSGKGKYNYRLFLSEGNTFVNQAIQLQRPTSNSWYDLIKKYAIRGGEMPAAKYELQIGRQSVTGHIGDDGSVTIEPKIDLAKYRENLQRNYQNAKNETNNIESRLNSAKSELQNARNRVANLQSDIDSERRKSPVDSGKISTLNSRLSSAREDVRDAETKVNRLSTELDVAEQKEQNLSAQVATAKSNENLNPSITLSLARPVKEGEEDTRNSNPSFKDLKITFEHGDLFIDQDGRLMDMSLKLETYDVSYWKTLSMRSWSGNTQGQLQISADGRFQASQLMKDSRGQDRPSLPADHDPYLNMEKVCEQANQQIAFQGANWSVSFAPGATYSWGFTTPYDARVDVILTASNSYMPASGVAAGTTSFQIHSVAKNCIIDASANFVTGFFTCEKLVIRARSTPLRIIGSFIVFNGVDIDNSVYTSGLRWGSIYDPMATFELRRAGVLKALGSNSDCTQINRFPVWHPYPSITDVANLYRCNAISLRAKADPYRWTAVDPDCGILPGSPTPQCKNRIVNAYVLEVSRESGI